MDGQTVLIVDDGTPVPLVNLPDTGDWNAWRWSRAASVRLTAGEHRLKWQNAKGGGINLEAFALSDDPAWTPITISLPKPAADKHVVVIQAENFVRCQGKQLSVSGSMAGSNTEFHYAPGTFQPAWAQAPGAEVHIFQSASCRAFKEIVSIAKVDAAAGIVTVAGKECLVPLQPGDRYFVENVFDQLDSPGEWYLDRSTGRLFYWPPDDLPTDGGRRRSRGRPPDPGARRRRSQAAGQSHPIRRAHVPGNGLLARRRLRRLQHGQRRRGVPERRHGLCD